MIRLKFTAIAVTILGLCACSGMPYQKSDHFDGHEFSNNGKQINKSFFDLLKWKFTDDDNDWPETVENKIFEPINHELQAGEISTTYINHASHLIQTQGLNILTDPIFSERASPFSFLGPKRVRPPGMTYEQLPKILTRIAIAKAEQHKSC